MSAAVRAVFAPRSEGPWLFGKRTDLAVFGGSALAALGLLAVGGALGLLDGESPGWTWIACVLAIDVAHVWSTVFRVYLDPAEVRRRPLLYVGAPLLCWGLGVMLYAFGPMTFWRALAYAAVFHFVRQQWGWVALYRRRAGETLDRWLDMAAVYAATVYPLIWWHAHLPRGFVWFLQGDFVVGLAAPVATLLAPVYWGVMIAFAARQLWRWRRGTLNPGKALVVFTTWLCWWLGIMVFDGDFAFTVTNVIIHGVPYLALTYRYGRARAAERPGGLLAVILRGGALAFLAFVVIVAFAEEALWDRYVWHDRPWLFGEGLETSDAVLPLLVPLLAVPQATHYLLDGFIWKVRGGNPSLSRELGGRGALES